MEPRRLMIEEESSIMEPTYKPVKPITISERLENQQRESIILTKTFMFVYDKMDKSKFIQQMRIVYRDWWQNSYWGKKEETAGRKLPGRIFLIELIDHLEKGGDKDKDRRKAALVYCKRWSKVR